jgi:outer membrane protein TolC
VVGVNMPIFEGFKVDSEIKEAESIVSSKAEDEKAILRKVQEDNFKFDERIESSRAQLKNLDKEFNISQTGYQLARKRYDQFQGTLLDLKETITNLYRVKNDLVRVRLTLDLNIFLKIIYNGYL